MNLNVLDDLASNGFHGLQECLTHRWLNRFVLRRSKFSLGFESNDDGQRNCTMHSWWSNFGTFYYNQNAIYHSNQQYFLFHISLINYYFKKSTQMLFWRCLLLLVASFLTILKTESRTPTDSSFRILWLFYIFPFWIKNRVFIIDLSHLMMKLIRKQHDEEFSW